MGVVAMVTGPSTPTFSSQQLNLSTATAKHRSVLSILGLSVTSAGEAVVKVRGGWGGVSPTCSGLPPRCDLNSTWSKRVVPNYDSWIMCYRQNWWLRKPRNTPNQLLPGFRSPDSLAGGEGGSCPCLSEPPPTLMHTTLTTAVNWLHGRTKAAISYNGGFRGRWKRRMPPLW